MAPEPHDSRLTAEMTAHLGEACGTVIELRGLTKVTRTILRNHPLVINYFPFRIGRISRSDMECSARQDLLIPDQSPYHISRKHIIIEKVGPKIRLTDDDSTCGTVVNGQLLGGKLDAAESIDLPPGIHTLLLGGLTSPYVFQFEVRKTTLVDYITLGTQPLPDRVNQARLLYGKLCRLTTELLGDRNKAAYERAFMAEAMARALVGRTDLAEIMRFLAANPVPAGDLIADHSVKMAINSVNMFTHLEYPTDEVIKIAAAGLLHDIGMYTIDRNTLSKSGALTGEEYEEVKRHTVRGADLLQGAGDICSLAAAVARDHHERADGSGYPRGSYLLQDIPGFMGMLDIFTAATHDRPHRKGMTPHAAVKALSGTAAFGPDMRKVFLNVFSFFPVASIVRLSSGEIGQVVRTNEGRPLAPQVQVLFGSDGRAVHELHVIDLGTEPGTKITGEIADQTLIRGCGSRWTIR